MTVPAGWYPDPGGTTQLRYYDGAAWTDDYAPAPKTGTVETFSRAMIEKFLAAAGLSFTLDSDGYLVKTEFVDAAGCDVMWLLAARGDNQEILTLGAILQRRIPDERWTEAVAACNQWNLDNSWPMVSLNTDVGTHNAGKFITKLVLDLEQGIHQELLDDTIAVFIAAVGVFAKWVREQMPL